MIPPTDDARGREQMLLTAARELTDPVQRRAFLDQACAGNPQRRQRLEQLLAVPTAPDELFYQATPALERRAFSMPHTQSPLISPNHASLTAWLKLPLSPAIPHPRSDSVRAGAQKASAYH